MGWHCITIWECELKPQKREQTLVSLEYTLNHIFLKDHTVNYYINEEEETLRAAEDTTCCYTPVPQINSSTRHPTIPKPGQAFLYLQYS